MTLFGCVNRNLIADTEVTAIVFRANNFRKRDNYRLFSLHKGVAAELQTLFGKKNLTSNVYKSILIIIRRA